MLPFLPPFPNQSQAQGGDNDPSLNQFQSSTEALTNQLCFSNPQFPMPAMGGLHNQNALLGALLAQQHLIQGLQNNLIGALSQQGQFHSNAQIMPQFHAQQQLNLIGCLQNPNLFSLQQAGLLGGAPLGQNMNQMLGFSSNGLLCQQNPIFAPNSHPPAMSSSNPNLGFVGNPQVAQSKSNLTGLETQGSSQKAQEPILPSLVQNKMPGGRQWSQMTHGQLGGKYFPNNSSENTASKIRNTKFNGLGKREPSHMRFQKSHPFNSRNDWQKERPFPRNDGRAGQHKGKERSTNFSESNGNAPTTRKRPTAVIYSQSEIQQWLETRKKNFPTRTNIEKKLSFSTGKREDTDSDAKLRRQQLKEVLAKQAELGVEVAEIPSIYLTEPGCSEGSSINVQTPQQRTNNKRGRFGRHNRLFKKPKFRNESTATHEPVVKKREPTLLKKLLNADIRRDKSHLLQAFRFMVLNSFFEGPKDKPLVFPLITAKDVMREPEVVTEEKLSQNKVDSDDNFIGKNGNTEDIEKQRDPIVAEAVESELVEDDIDDAGDVDCEPLGEKSEEGEITD